MTIPTAPGFYVYIHRDGDDAAVYVGQTRDPSTHTAWHRSRSPWWHEVVTTEWLYCDTRADAKEREREEIWSLQPRYNVRSRFYTPPVRRGVADDCHYLDEITTRQALEILGLKCHSTISRWVADGTLTPVRKLPGRTGAYLFARADIERLAGRDARGQAS